MRKKILDKIYFIMLLATIFSSSYVMLCDIASKGNNSCGDTDIELLEDGSMSDATDSNETSVDHANDGITESVFLFHLDNFANIIDTFFYLQNTYEIYLGLNTPPPKYL